MATTETKRWDVVVVGAGPVGLSLALGLARREHSVLVLEKEATTSEHSRAPAIWPGTQEILDKLGVIRGFLNEGIVVRKLQLWDADRGAVLLSLPLEELAGQTAYPHLLVLPQSRTERLLLAALQREPTAEVRFSCEATGFVQEETQAVVHYAHSGELSSVAGRVVAGCDGAHSTVRETLGARFDGTTYAVRAALADVEVDVAPDLPFPRLTIHPQVAIAIRIQERVWRLILPFVDSPRIPLEQRVQQATERLLAEKYRPVWQSEFHLHRRVSTCFADRRVVLAGDAAHLNSPVGGQGMNAGFRDAALLIEVISQTLGSESIGPIEEYASVRQQQIRQGVNRFTDLLTRTLLFRRGRMLRPIFRLASVALRISTFRRRFLHRLAMLDDIPFDR